MNVIITGATGMVGKGVLLECLDSPEIAAVLVINRRPLDVQHPKIREIIHKDFYDLSAIETELQGYDACFFCLGVSSSGVSKETYYKMTYELTMHMAETLVRLNPDMTFCYVSGEGTDSEEKSRMNWANVKGKTENALLGLPFKQKYMFRPGYIQPERGIKSATALYNAMYVIFKPLYPIVKRIFPHNVTSTTQLGQAMIKAASQGYEKAHLPSRDINLLAAR